MRRIAAIFPVIALASACVVDDGATLCGVEGGVAVSGSASARTVVSSEGERVVRVEGSVQHASGRAFRSVAVEGRLASPSEGAFNFSAWSVDLPLSYVAGLAPNAQGSVQLKAAALDACGQRWEFASVSLAKPSLGDVRTLSVELEAPSGEAYVPTTRAEAATVRVVANGEGDGAEATVSVSAGSLSGGLDAAGSTNRVRLASESGGTSRGLLRLTVDEPGVVLVTVRAGDRVATGTLLAAGAPAFTPSSATLQAGTVLDVVARSPGRIATCTVEAEGGVAVEQGGVARTGAFEPGTESGEPVAFEVTVPADDTDPFALTIRCEDAFGQAATFTAED